MHNIFEFVNTGVEFVSFFCHCLTLEVGTERQSRNFVNLPIDIPKREDLVMLLQFAVKQSVPLQACSGPEGSRKLRFPGSMTTAQDVGKVISLTHRPPLLPGNTSGTHFC
jgi:hypothetical protein